VAPHNALLKNEMTEEAAVDSQQILSDLNPGGVDEGVLEGTAIGDGNSGSFLNESDSSGDVSDK